jgi:hypothetical protein
MKGRFEAVNRTSRNAFILAWGTVVTLLALAVAPAAAHHSFAMYDMETQKTVTGKLIRFVLGGNHSQFVMQIVNPDGSLAVDKDKKDENGQPTPVIWTIETAAAVQIARQGITVESFKPGTIFSITFSPLRDGRPGGAQREGGLIMCGTKLPDGGCNAKTGKKY